MTNIASIEEIHARARRELVDGQLNFREVGWDDLMGWWEWRKRVNPFDPKTGLPLSEFDVQSIQTMFEEWVCADFSATKVADFTQFVVGFLFRNEGAEVAMILKRRPVWQRGRLNGLGGHVNPGEDEVVAMTREFQEEAGCLVETWERVCAIQWPTGRCAFFRAFGDLPIRSMTDELVSWKVVSELGNLNVVDNVRWVVPLALEAKDPATLVVSVP